MYAPYLKTKILKISNLSLSQLISTCLWSYFPPSHFRLFALSSKFWECFSNVSFKLLILLSRVKIKIFLFATSKVNSNSSNTHFCFTSNSFIYHPSIFLKSYYFVFISSCSDFCLFLRGTVFLHSIKNVWKFSSGSCSIFSEVSND